MHTHTSLDHHPHAPGRSGRLGLHLRERWPAVLGLLALLINVVNGADPHVTAMIIVIASVCYLAASAIGTGWSGWAMVAVASVAVVSARLLGLDVTVTLLVLGVGFVVLGLLRGRGVDRREFGAQALAFVGFSALAITAMMADPILALYLAALAAIGHAAWDTVYSARGTVVPKSLAEACFLLDLGLGIALILLATLS